MRGPGDLFDWQQNDDWWTIDEETHQFILTEKAPEEARISFKKYLKHLEERKANLGR